MDAKRQPEAVAHRSVRRTLGQEATETEDTVAQERNAAGALQRLTADPPVTFAQGAILGLQHTVGNRAVQRMLTPGVQRLPVGSVQPQPLAKIVGQEEELELAKTLQSSTVRRVAVAVAETDAFPDPAATPAGDLRRDRLQVTDSMAKAILAVQSGAAASHALKDTAYGLTFPERVDVEIGAGLDAGGKTWKPTVKKLTGKYSQQVRLLPGQSEITGPGGNTTKTNFCSQCANLATLGNITGNKWYVIAAVVAHENVHATRFLPGLTDVEAAITTTIEAVTVPHTDPMTEAEAIKKLEADGAYQTAVKKAYQLWLIRCATLVAGDHDGGGPTDQAEETVTKPLLKTICEHAKKEKWPACEICDA